MGNPRNGGKKDYNFDYFERMNQKQQEQQNPISRGSSDPPQGHRQRPPNSPADRRQQRNAAAQRNRNAARQVAQRSPDADRTRSASGSPRDGGLPRKPERPERGVSSRPQEPRQPKAAKKPRPAPPPSKPPKPSKPKKPKKEKPSLSPEQRRKRRRRNWILFYISLFLVVVTAGVILSLTVLFHVDEIMVTGESRYTQEEIVQVSQLKTGENLFMTDTQGAAERIQSSLPYVGSVKISRKLPGTLVIQVDDVMVAGAVQYGDGYLVVGANGKALEQVPYLPEGCASIVGAKLSQAEIGKMVQYADEEQTELIQKLTMAAEENELDKVTQIDISDPYNVKLVYDGRITLAFGLPTDLEYKVRFAQSVLNTGKILETDKGVLDLSLAKEMSKAYFDPDYTVSSSSSQTVFQDPNSSVSSSSASSLASSAPASQASGQSNPNAA